jgi:hypothetical protein
MSLITRQQKGSKLTIQEMDGNLEYLQSLSATTILTEYPETTPELAGTRFWYKGNEWHYMTQAEIDSTEWTGLVDVGFPAPVSKVPNIPILLDTNENFKELTIPNSFSTISIIDNLISSSPTIEKIDFVGLGVLVNRIKILNFRSNGTTLDIINSQLLKNLEDIGTTIALNFSGLGIHEISSNTLNKLFTELPSTNKTVTIRLIQVTGAATCDPTIATAKGYTVIT